jgi:hypothetical protein
MAVVAGSLEDRLRLVDSIDSLGHDWHGAGSVARNVLEGIARMCPSEGFKNSLETGCGRSTLLLSQLSQRHTVFTYSRADTGYLPDNSHSQTQGSRLLNASTTRFVLGATQQTLPKFEFEGPYDFALLDGPHGYPYVQMEYYYVYQQLQAGAILALDDIHIPSVHHLFEFLCDEAMFQLDQVIDKTAFFVRTECGLFNPLGDGWDGQGYNMRRFPVSLTAPPSLARRIARRVVPEPMKVLIRKMRG